MSVRPSDIPKRCIWGQKGVVKGSRQEDLKKGLEEWFEIAQPNLAGGVQRIVEQAATTVVVIGLAFLKVKQHVMGLLHRPKLRRRIKRRISVRVIKRCLLAERLLDIGQCCGTVQAEGGVVVCQS